MSRYQRTMGDALQSVADSQMEFDEAVKWEVKVTGLPTFYADGKSKGEVKIMLRKLLKRPDDIISIERKSLSAVKQIRRGQLAGKDPGEEEEVKEELLLEDNRAVQVQNKELTVDDIVNMIQFGKPFTVGEDIPATLPPGNPNFPKYKDIPNSVVDKEDKKANKAKARAEKDILIPTQTQEGIASGAGKVVGGLVGGALGLGVNRATGLAVGGGIMKAGAALQKKLDKNKEKIKKENFEMWLEDSDWAKQKRIDKEVSDRLLKIQQEREARYQRQKAQLKDKRDQNKDPVGKTHEALDTWHPDPKKDKVTKHQARLLPTSPKKSITKSRKSNVDFKDLRPQFKSEEHDCNETHPDAGVPLSVRRARKKKSAAQMKVDMRHADQLSKIGQGRRKEQQLGNVGIRPTPKWYHPEETEIITSVKEVAPPGWGHTKAEKEKTKPDKPKSKIGGSAHEFKKDLDSGKFKGLPGDKTYKDKKASMFKLMWSMKNKSDKPHYKPGVKDKLKAKYKKDESVLDSAKRYLENG